MGGSGRGQHATHLCVCVCVCEEISAASFWLFSLLVNTGDSFLRLSTFDTRSAMRSTARTFSNWMLAL